MAASPAFRSSSSGLLTGGSSQLARRSDRTPSSRFRVSGEGPLPAAGSLLHARLICTVAYGRQGNARSVSSLRPAFVHRKWLEQTYAVWSDFVGLRQGRSLPRRSPAPGVACDGIALTAYQQPDLQQQRLIRFDPLGVSNSKRKRMATMTLPRALVEDTPEAVPLFVGDVEGKRTGRKIINVVRAGSDGYGTFDSGNAKSLQDGHSEDVTDTAAYAQWNNLTARLADSATAAFLILQLPQIILNTQNLLAGNYIALSAVPWMGQLTGLLGNLSLLSYFAGKKERGATVVQAVGVVSTLAVLVQLAIAEAMPRAAFSVIATGVAIGLSLNFFNYKGLLSPKLWRVWEEAVTVAGITVLPQVMWSTFDPYLPPSLLPAMLFGGWAVTMVVLGRLGKLPEKLSKFMRSLSAWTATLLFMWGPVSQMWQNFLIPANIKGLSVFTIVLAMVGNGLLLPRAIFTRDLMWSTGAAWGFFFQGWGILLSMYTYSVIGDPVFWGLTAGVGLWISGIFFRDSRAYDLSTPFSSLIELLSGSRNTS